MTGGCGPDEFALIARDLAPLAGEGSRGLADDVAELAGLIVTTDTIACGTHFLPDDPLDTVARKAIRVNVSDLVAKGCRPVAMTLAAAWHPAADADDHALFAQGLGEDLRAYGLALLGGDTTRLTGGPGPVVTATMFGAPIGRVPDRASAKVGDAVIVTGTIGDAWLGLQALRGGGPSDEASIRAYRLPEPPVAAAPLVAEFASASLDVSDGLIADAAHIGRASGLRMRLRADAVPLSAAGASFAGRRGIGPLVTGGDDYQALMTVPGDRVDAALAAAPPGLRLTVAGSCEAGEPGAVIVDAAGGAIDVGQPGYRHF